MEKYLLIQKYFHILFSLFILLKMGYVVEMVDLQVFAALK
jgi:hypothetical protein